MSDKKRKGHNKRPPRRDPPRRLHYYEDQRYQCLFCGKCCGLWDVAIRKSEKESIEKLAIPGFNFIERDCFESFKKNFFLIKKIDGRCVLLDEENRCLIHKHCGFEAKPLACRLYPFEVFNWTDESVSAALRFDCPAAALGEGEKISSFDKFFLSISQEFSKQRRNAYATYGETLDPGLRKIRIITRGYESFLLDDKLAAVTRLFAAARLIEFHEATVNRSDVAEADEQFMANAKSFVSRSVDDLEMALAAAHELNLNHRVLFRYLVSGYARIDEEVSSRFYGFGRLSRAKSILLFSLGKGSLRKLGENYPDSNGLDPLKIAEDLVLDDSAERPYWRFLASKLSSLHFCGSPTFKFTFEHGMRHLLLTYPVTMAFASLRAASERRDAVTDHDVSAGVAITDHTFSRSPFFKLRHVKKMMRTLCSQSVFPSLLNCFRFR